MTGPTATYQDPKGSGEYRFAIGTVESTIIKYGPTGEIVDEFSIEQPSNDLVVDPDQNLYFIGDGTDPTQLYCYRPDGTLQWKQDAPSAYDSIRVDDDGVYVPQGGGSIQKYTLNGSSAGWDPTIPDSEITMDGIWGITPDRAGGVYASVDTEGTGPGQLIHVDASGTVVAHEQLHDGPYISEPHYAPERSEVDVVVDNEIWSHSADLDSAYIANNPLADSGTEKYSEELKVDDDGAFYYFTDRYDSSIAKYTHENGVEWDIVTSGNIEEIDITNDGELHLYNNDAGALYSYDTDTGEKLWQTSVPYRLRGIASYPDYSSFQSEWYSITRISIQPKYTASRAEPDEPTAHVTSSPVSTELEATSTPLTPTKSLRKGAMAASTASTSAPTGSTVTSTAAPMSAPTPSASTPRTATMATQTGAHSTPTTGVTSMFVSGIRGGLTATRVMASSEPTEAVAVRRKEAPSVPTTATHALNVVFGALRTGATAATIEQSTQVWYPATHTSAHTTAVPSGSIQTELFTALIPNVIRPTAITSTPTTSASDPTVTTQTGIDVETVGSSTAGLTPTGTAIIEPQAQRVFATGYPVIGGTLFVHRERVGRGGSIARFSSSANTTEFDSGSNQLDVGADSTSTEE